MGGHKDRLVARGLAKRYRGRPVVGGFGFALRPGEAVALLGPNGAGKSTVMGMVTGLVHPDAGRVEIDGVDISDAPLHIRAARGLAYLPQESSVFVGLSVEDNILVYLEAAEPDRTGRASRLEDMLERFGLAALRKQSAGRLSGGERRRCEIARAVAIAPRYLILDEPFAGVDPLAIADLKTTIGALAGQGIGVLISDHNVRETLPIVDRAYVMSGGVLLASGTPNEIVANQAVRDHYLGASFDEPPPAR